MLIDDWNHETHKIKIALFTVVPQNEPTNWRILEKEDHWKNKIRNLKKVKKMGRI